MLRAAAREAALLSTLLLISACHTEEHTQPRDAGHETDANAPEGEVLQGLSLEEAPAPTRTFFWAKIPLSAPGFAVPDRDMFTIALDADNQLRYLSWSELPSFPKTFGDEAKDFPLTGMKRVDTHPEYTSVFDVTVEDAPAPTSTHFLLRMRVVEEGHTDYVESTEGMRSGDGWDVVYTEKGNFRGPAIDAHAEGTLFPGDPDATGPSEKGSLWSAPVELTAPGFTGPPVDHLTLALDERGHPRSFHFDAFRRDSKFGTDEDVLPTSGTVQRGGLKITVDDAVPPTKSHFVLRYHTVGHEGLSDFVEGFDGTIEDDTLVIRYFVRGEIWGAKIDAHAAGTLVPASE